MKTKGIFLILTVILATSQIGCKKDSIKSDKCNLEAFIFSIANIITY